MYNNYECVNMKEIASLLTKRNGKFYLYEHYFIWFKDYFQYYLKSMYTLLHEDGFLPRPWRFYIAIMSASTMRSHYLLKILEENFIEAGGDESWLIHGLDVVPEKIVRLGRIINIISHQPWIMIPDDIKDINADKEQKDHSYWNVNELMHAILIMIQFHKIAIIVESLKIQLNKDTFSSKLSNDVKDESNFKQKLIMNLEKIISEDQDDNQIITIEGDLEINDPCKINLTESKFTKHINTFCNVYHDFDPHSEEYRSYLVNIYNNRNLIGKIKATIF
jgi:hypothetical protein